MAKIKRIKKKKPFRPNKQQSVDLVEGVYRVIEKVVRNGMRTLNDTDLALLRLGMAIIQEKKRKEGK